MSGATVVSLAEWRERHTPFDPPPPAAPMLRLVPPGGADAFRLEVFLARARAVMGEQRPELRLVGGGCRT